MIASTWLVKMMTQFQSHSQNLHYPLIHLTPTYQGAISILTLFWFYLVTSILKSLYYNDL